MLPVKGPQRKWLRQADAGERKGIRRGPLATLGDVEEITADWVHWHNTSRLMHRLGRRPPVEHEADYHARNRDGQQADHT